MSWILSTAYGLVLLGLSGYGLKVALFTAGWLWVRRRESSARPLWAEPCVTVQLPIYNERTVARRAIDAACRLRWPADRLEIQVLDDSTDDTRAVIDAAVAAWQRRGRSIRVIRRPHRDGFKAGALANGLAQASGEVLAVLDADFVPPTDFLERCLPHLVPGVAAVQARWSHLNPNQTLVTRIQSLALDGYFVIEQTVRSRLGLFVNFNGTAGLWRREAVASAGGWQGDTLAEDTDLSFRAQMAGWRIVFLPEVTIPAELPADMVSFQRQQRRWATGTTQLLVKLGPDLIRAPLPFVVRLHALLTLAGHLAQPLTLLALLGSPVLLVRPPGFPAALGLVAVLALAPPVMYALALAALDDRWLRRLAGVYPWLALVALGMSLNGSLAVGRAIAGRAGSFDRTPKAGDREPARHGTGARSAAPALRQADPLAIAEALLATYALAVLLAVVAAGRAASAALPGLFAAGFALTSGLALAPPLRQAMRSSRSWPLRSGRAWPVGRRLRAPSVAPRAAVGHSRPAASRAPR